MRKIKNFFNESGYLVVAAFMFVIFLQTCHQNSTMSTLRKEVVNVRKANDSMATQLKTEIKLEGLKSELRMIQATDRKILDVQRQNQIEQEIKSVQNVK
jgi:hypothetical protein